MNFADLPIQRKLLVMSLIATGTALFMAAASFLAYDRVTFQDSLSGNLTAIADIVGYNSASAIIFNDTQTAQRNLQALQARESVVGAALYTSTGTVFARWSRGPEEFALPTLPEAKRDVIRFGAKTVEIFHPLFVDKSYVGTAYLVSSLDALRRRAQRYSLIVAGVMVVCFFFAGIVSQNMGRRISKPILDLVRVAQRVSTEKTYGVRAVTSAHGEIGLLVQTFNEMLTQIEQRGQALLRANEVLEQKVRERTQELQQKEEELYQSRRLESVGRLAGGVAHDFNNLLTGIIGCSETLEEEIPADHPLAVEVKEIKRAAERASSLTRQLLAFGRKQIISPQSLDLNKVIQSIGKLLTRLIGEDVTLVYDLSPAIGPIHADPGQMEQVIVNLVVNARDAMPRGGKLIIRTQWIQVESESHPFELPQGDYILLSITDTGIGMTKEIQSQIFEPFFTTKGIGKGTGLGLATVYGIIKQNHGDIQVVSHPGIGTTFRIFLPLEDGGATAGPGSNPHADRKEKVPGGTETILLVEDEVLVASHIARALRRKGYAVLTAANGREALQLMTERDGKIDLVMTDVIMPEMNGRQFVEAMRKTWPGARVLYMSGHPEEVIAQQGVLESGLSFIEKPFNTDQICRKIREVLGA